LGFLTLDHNSFTGNLDSFASSTYVQENMKYLFLESNLLDGDLDPQFFRHFPNLLIMDLSDNLFGGNLPYNLFTLPELLVLDLHDNNFVGQLPGADASEIPINNKLEFLALHKNGLNGMLPNSFTNLKEIWHLDLSDNELEGTVPTILGTLSNLEYLFVSQNAFVPGPIPEFLTKLFKLEELSMKSTYRTGVIPPFLGDLSNMVLLDLDNNQLSGAIPTELGQLSKLQFLLLNRNLLTSAIPDEVNDLRYIRVLYLDGNDVSGNLTSFCDRGLGYIKPVMAADCGGESPTVVCDCCEVCCSTGEFCNDDDIIPSNDPMWQFGYSRLFFDFGNETGTFVAIQTP